MASSRRKRRKGILQHMTTVSFVLLISHPGLLAIALNQKCSGRDSCPSPHDSSKSCNLTWQQPHECGFICIEDTHTYYLDDNCHLPPDPYFCHAEDVAVENFTFIRYVILGLIMIYRATVLIREAGATHSKSNLRRYSQSNIPDIPERERSVPLGATFVQPMTEARMKGTLGGLIHAYFLAGCIFILSEGVGLVIYFMTSAILDNFSIFIVNPGHEYCKSVTLVALYSAAIITFLPNCILAWKLQADMFEKGGPSKKVLFVVIMVCTTGLFFVLRLHLVYGLGWAALVDDFLGDSSKDGTFGYSRVLFASSVPPLVDLVQSVILIATSHKAAFAPEEGSAVSGREPLLK